MTNGQSSRVIAASGTDRRIRLRRPAPAGTPPTAPGTANGPRHGRQAPARNKIPRLQKMLHVAPACCCAGQPSPGPATAQTNRRPRQSSLKPAITQTGRRPSRSSLKPSPAPFCHPIRSLPRPAAAQPPSVQKNAASPTGRSIPGCRHRLPYSHSIVAGGLEEMS